MKDARIFLNSLDEARKILAEHGAVSKGYYEIHDIIYAPKDASKTIADEFLRLRLVPVNIWNEKAVVLAIKNTKSNVVGKESVIPLKLQFDQESEARAYIEANLADKYAFDYEFSRIGWQYFMPNGDGVDLEDIEGHRSIEFKSPTQEGLEKILDIFGVKREDVIKSASVVAVKEMLSSKILR
ncbi:MAG TPA: hypothetical protein VGE35_02540 [Candidatus Paceibacterota bacterium]